MAGMNIACAVWRNRIAPVFDTAQELRVVETLPGRVIRETREYITDGLPVQKALQLVEFKVNTLVCGAISQPLHMMIVTHGIRVLPFVAGDVREVIQAVVSGGFDPGMYAMPGCRGRNRRRSRGGHGISAQPAPSTGQTGCNGPVPGRGRGPGARPARHGPGPPTSPQASARVCPVCGWLDPSGYGRDRPRAICPACGAAIPKR